MEFVFANIILNAVQAIGGSTGRITIGVRGGVAESSVSFENSGPVVGKKNMQRIFEPMFTTKMHGTGLGLTSCRNIVELHSGRITATDGPVTFTIHLPNAE